MHIIIHTFLGGGIGLCVENVCVVSISEANEDILSVDWPFDSRDDGNDVGVGGGGPRGLWTLPVCTLES